MRFALAHPFIPPVKIKNTRDRGRFKILIPGGDEGIRTPDTVARIRDFESRAFNQLCHISVAKEIISIWKQKAIIKNYTSKSYALIDFTIASTSLF